MVTETRRLHVKGVTSEIMFDRSGGATLKLGRSYWHYYTDMEQLVSDFIRYNIRPTTKGWSGNERGEYDWIEYDEETEQQGQAKWLTLRDVVKILKENINADWSSEMEVFFDALRSRLLAHKQAF